MSRAALSPDEWQRFQELLPWYANRTLGPEERREMDHWITASAECRAEFMEVMALAWQVQIEKVTVDEKAGLDKLMAMVRAHDSGKLVTLLRPAPGERAPADARRTPSCWYKPALAIAAAVTLIQAGAILLYHLPAETPTLVRPLGVSAPAANSTLIQATFHGNVADIDARGLFAKVGAEIVSGPGALGIYTVKVPTANADAVLAELRLARGMIDIAILLAN